MTKAAQNKTANDDGFTLLAVVAAVMVLSIVVMTLTKSASALMFQARAATDRAGAEFLADGLAELTARHLSLNPIQDTRSGNLPTTGLPIACRQGEAHVEITVTPTNGQIDLNLAPPALLLLVLKGAGLDDAKAQEITNDIIDYRSYGNASLSGDNKLARYIAASRPFGAKQAPFSNTQELDQLPSMTRDLFGRLSPLFTVRSEQRFIDPMKASYPVVRALNGMGLAPADPQPSEDEIVRLRRETAMPLDLKVPAKTRSERRKHSFSFLISVTTELASGARFERIIIAGLEPGKGEPAEIVEWSEGHRSSGSRPLRSNVAGPSCLGDVLWVRK